MDLDAIWRSLHAAATSRLAALPGLRLPPLLRLLADDLLRAAPVITRKDDKGVLFELHPMPELAGPRNWCWIMPVRVARGDFPIHLSNAAMPEQMARERSVWDLCFGDMIDLVALSPDCGRVIGRFTGNAAVIGNPQWPDGDDATKLRLCRDPASWFRTGMQGVLMLGDRDEQIAFLRGWHGGIVCDDLAHGKTIDRLLRRAYAGPPVLVAA